MTVFTYVYCIENPATTSVFGLQSANGQTLNSTTTLFDCRHTTNFESSLSFCISSSNSAVSSRCGNKNDESGNVIFPVI